MKDLTVALLQQPIDCLNPSVNETRLEAEIAKLAPGVDLIVLAEVFTSGFGSDFGSGSSSGSSSGSEGEARVGEPEGDFECGTVQHWMRLQAKKSGAVITGSIIIKTKAGDYVNRLLWVRPDGSFEQYDKCHLFRMGGEHLRYAAGTEKIILDLKGWRVCPLICYDLRFPVFSRNRYTEGHYDYDLLVYVANWPAARRLHWRSLLVARAIENQACVVGVNRVGVDAKGLDYSGDSLAVDARGELLVAMESSEGTAVCSFSGRKLSHYRDSFPVYLDADHFTLEL